MADGRQYQKQGSAKEPLESLILSLPENTIQVAARQVEDCWEVSYIVETKPKKVPA